MGKKITSEGALQRMAALCARSEQCEADIRQKLYRMGLSSGDVQKIIEELTAGKFIDNARFARSFARDKCRFSCWGRNKIRLELKMRRITPPDIEQALDSIDKDEYLDALHRATSAKGRSLDVNGPERRTERLKLFRHLLARGFESELASNAIKEFVAANR